MKNLGALTLLLFVLFAVSWAHSQTKKRTAVLRAGSQFVQAEQTIAEQVSTLLVDDGRIEVVDRDQLARIINEQNLQHYFVQPNGQPRVAPDSAVQLGQLLGVPAIVFVRIDTYYGSQHPPVNNGKRHTVSGNVVLKATAQVVNVQTGAIFASPTASFEQERVLSESTDGRPPGVIGPFRIPQGKATHGPDPAIGLRKLTDEAFDFVEHDLAGKIANAIVTAPLQTPRQGPVKIPKVAGVQNGMTFVNAGANAGLKIGDTFQIIRMIDSGMQDPDTHQTILRKKQVCLLTISEVEDSLASGRCTGDLALPGDQAIAQGH